MRDFLRRHGSTILNVVLVIALGRYAAVKAWEAWRAEAFNFVEVAFAAHNIVMLTMILVRRRHQAMDRNVVHQAVALGAFFSGILYVKHPTPHLAGFSQAVMVGALVLSTVSLVNLGRSFGILIALRQVKTGGLYRLVRHPMYLTDILWRIGYVLGNLYWPNVLILAASSAAYVWRAMLEERLLSQFEEYRHYMQQVRYRFVPGVF